MTATAHTLDLRGLTVVRAGTRVLDDISLSVTPGEIVAIIGPNGAGKTTLLEAAIGAVPLAAGLVLVGGRELRGIADRARQLDYLSGEAEPPSEVRVATLLTEVTANTTLDPTWVQSPVWTVRRGSSANWTVRPSAAVAFGPRPTRRFSSMTSAPFASNAATRHDWSAA